jgi:hypothetical protein
MSIISLYRGAEDNRQDHPPSQADLRGQTATSASSSLAGTPDGSRGDGVILREIECQSKNEIPIKYAERA